MDVKDQNDLKRISALTEEIESEITALSRIITRLEENAGTISAIWRCEPAGEYLHMFREVYDEICDIRSEMQNSARLISSK